MKRLLKIQGEGTRKQNQNVWGGLLCAIGLHAEISFWDLRINKKEKIYRKQQLCLPEET